MASRPPCWNAARFTSASDTNKIPVAVSRASHCAGRGFGRVRPIAPAWPRRNDRYRPPRKLPVAAARFRLLYSEVVQRSLPSRRRRAQHSAREPRAAHLARAGRGRSRGRDHSIAPANGSLHVENRARNTSSQPLRDRFAIQWDNRRPMPPYAKGFCDALAKYMREVLPITQASVGKSAAAWKREANIRRPVFIFAKDTKGVR